MKHGQVVDGEAPEEGEPDIPELPSSTDDGLLDVEQMEQRLQDLVAAMPAPTARQPREDGVAAAALAKMRATAAAAAAGRGRGWQRQYTGK